MSTDPISIYSSQGLGFDQNRDGGSARQTFAAHVSTRTIGMQLGKLGISLSTQNISLADEPAPTILKDFAEEVELQLLARHITPFRAAGSYILNTTTQRLGLAAYSQQASLRQPAAMISVLV